MTEHRNNSTQKQRISSFEPGTMFLGTILAVLSAIVCMQILGKVGVSANYLDFRCYFRNVGVQNSGKGNAKF